MKQNSYILWLLPDEQLYFGRFGEPFWLVGYPLILPQQEYEDSENHKARLSVHASVKNPCPQIMSLWRSGHFDYFIPFSKMQQLRAKLWRQKTLKTKRLYQPQARRHSCGNYRARGCQLWAWVLCHLGLSPNCRCSTARQQRWVLAQLHVLSNDLEANPRSLAHISAGDKAACEEDKPVKLVWIISKLGPVKLSRF